MNTISCRLITTCLALCLFFQGPKVHCLGLESTTETISPLTIVGIASADQITKRLERLAEEVGLEAQLQQYLTWIPNSLDRTRPIGVVTLNGIRESEKNENNLTPDLDAVLLIPVKDATALLTQLVKLGFIEDLMQKGSVWEFRAPKANMWRAYAIERQGWLIVVADHRVIFDKIPNNLGNTMQSLSERLDLFASLIPSQFPPVIRERFLEELTKSLDHITRSNLQEIPETVSYATFKKEFAEGLFNAFNSIDQCTVGLSLTGPDASSSLEMTVSLDPDSTASRELKRLSETPSLFSKFGYEQEAVRTGTKIRLPKFIADFYAADFTTAILDERRKELEASFTNSKDRLGLSLESRSLIFNELNSIFSDTFQSGNIDFLTLVGRSSSESVFMFRLADPKRIETILLELQKALQSRSALGKIEMNVEKYKGVAIHSVSLSNRDDAGNRIVQSAIQPVGDEIKIGIGISKEVMMFSTGDSPVVELKKALDSTRNPALGKNRDDILMYSEFSVSYAISQMVAIGNPNALKLLNSQPNFSDKIKYELKTILNGLSGRLALKHETLKWIVSEFPRIVDGLQEEAIEENENPFTSLPRTEEPSSMTPQVQNSLPSRSQASLSPPSSMQRPSRTDRSGSNDAPLVLSENVHLETVRFEDLPWGVKGIDFSPDGRILAAGKPDQTVVLLDIVNESKVSMLGNLAKLGSAQKCMFTPDGKKLVVGGQSGELVVFAIAKNHQMKQILEFSGHSGEIHCLAMSEDGKRVLSGDQSKKVFCWDISSGDIVANIGGFDGPIKAVRLDSKERIAYATDGSRLIEFDLAKKKITTERKLTASWASGQAAAFSPNGEYIAVGDTYEIRLWNLKTGKELPKLTSQEIQWSMQFTPNSEQLLSGGNGKVYLWDIKTSKLSSIQKVVDFVYIQSLAISRDGKQFSVPSSQDVRVFEFAPPILNR